jgi:hypothetical protein
MARGSDTAMAGRTKDRIPPRLTLKLVNICTDAHLGRIWGGMRYSLQRGR